MSPNALTLLWTYAPFIVAGVAFGVTKPRLPATILIANLLAGQAFGNQVADSPFSPWVALGYGCIDYTTAVFFVGVGKWRCAIAMIASVITHVIFAVRLHGVTDPYVIYAISLDYGWCSFTIAMVIGILLLEDGRGGGRRIRNGRIGSVSSGNYPRYAGLVARAWRVRG